MINLIKAFFQCHVVAVASLSSAVDLSAHPVKPVKTGDFFWDKSFALYKVTILVNSI